MTISGRIREKYPRFSTKQKQIADYLIKNEEEISFKTLREISAAAGVTEVTVINFCKALGFVNFIELKECYRNEMITNFSPIKKTFEKISGDDAHSDLFREIVGQQLKNHQSAMIRLNEEDLDKAVAMISGARKVYILSVGLSRVIGHYLILKLENSAINAELVDINRINIQFFMKAANFTKDDLFICISFPNYARIVLKLAEHFKSRGFNVLSITDKETSPLVKYSSVSFLGDNESLSFYNSIQAAISIVEVITTILHRSRKEVLLSIQKDVESLEQEFSDFIS